MLASLLSRPACIFSLLNLISNFHKKFYYIAPFSLSKKYNTCPSNRACPLIIRSENQFQTFRNEMGWILSTYPIPAEHSLPPCTPIFAPYPRYYKYIVWRDHVHPSQNISVRFARSEIPSHLVPCRRYVVATINVVPRYTLPIPLCTTLSRPVSGSLLAEKSIFCRPTNYCVKRRTSQSHIF